MKLCQFPKCTDGDLSLEAFRACQECDLIRRQTDYPARTLADDIRDEEERSRRRFVYATRPKWPLSLQEAIDFSERMQGNPVADQ